MPHRWDTTAVWSFFDNLLLKENPHLWAMFRLGYGVAAARQVYFLNFNSLHIPGNCAVWGGRTQRVHTAFEIDWSGPEKWRASRSTDFKTGKLPPQTRDEMQRIERELRAMGADQDPRPTEDVRDGSGRLVPVENRIAPLVSDAKTWKSRLLDPDMTLQFREEDESLIPTMRKLAYTILNSNIRANFNSPDVLELLFEEAKQVPQPEERESMETEGRASSKTNH